MLADMRTGSNLFEHTIKSCDQIETFGELFNPTFVGQPKFSRENSTDFDSRDADPIQFLENKIDAHPDQLIGFRLFRDHDHRIFSHVLSDPNCLKIILRRNALDTYLSKKIARETDQWRVADWALRRQALVHFDPDEFSKYRLEQAIYYMSISESLKKTGQTSFNLGYEDLLDREIWQGIFTYLGVSDFTPELQSRLVKQNPGRPEEKVSNPSALEPFLSDDDSLDFPTLPKFIRHEFPKILLDASKGVGFSLSNSFWANSAEGQKLASLDRTFEVREAGILQSWQTRFVDHEISFFVEHPLHRAYRAFDDFLLSGKNRSGRRTLRNLAQFYDIGDLEKIKHAETLDLENYLNAFEQFLAYLKNQLSEGTKVKADLEWTFQYTSLQELQNLVPRINIVRQKIDDTDATFQGRIPFDQTISENTLSLALEAYKPDTIRFGF